MSQSNQVLSKVTIMAGGTGGHVFPGIAVAKEFQARGYDVTWLGAYGLELDLVPKAGIKLTSLPIKGLRGNGLMGWVLLPFKLIRAVFNAWKYLRHEKPQCVIGFGGFASAPGGIAAKLLSIPLVIHEQNGVAGLANRLLNRLSRLTLMGFQDVFPNGIFVGNPVRSQFSELPSYQERLESRRDQPLNILVLGGSQGARAVNTLVVGAAEHLTHTVNIWHQTGGGLLDETKALWQESRVEPYKVTGFIDDMPAAYAWADLVICRSGALTVAELLAANVASILIPFPYAVDDHQTKNGESLVESGAAIMFQEVDLDGDLLAKTIDQLNYETIKKMAEKTEALAKPNATREIADAIEEIIGQE